ncbi:MAG: hypothetical protein C0482_10680 [Gordonia sp.]|nr:hypothetical protein [Gordonia sp. (in: high G+C Gram-positive bacteria)]
MSTSSGPKIRHDNCFRHGRRQQGHDRRELGHGRRQQGHGRRQQGHDRRQLRHGRRQLGQGLEVRATAYRLAGTSSPRCPRRVSDE